jgi:phosphoglycerate-specific signal transduction histidine kinase
MGQLKSLYLDFLEKYGADTIDELQDELNLYRDLQSSGVRDEIHISFLENLINEKSKEIA